MLGLYSEGEHGFHPPRATQRMRKKGKPVGPLASSLTIQYVVFFVFFFFLSLFPWFWDHKIHSSFDFNFRLLVTLSWAVSRPRLWREVCAFVWRESVLSWLELGHII